MSASEIELVAELVLALGYLLTFSLSGIISTSSAVRW